MRAAALILIVGLLAPALPAAPEGGPPWDEARTETLVVLAREYAGKTDNYARDQVLARAKALGAVPDKAVKDVVKALFAVAKEGGKCDGKSECVSKSARFPGLYYMTGGGGGRKGIFVGLHGGGAGVGDGRNAQSQWGGAAGKGLICVFPTANLPDRQTTWESPEVEAFVIEILRELKRTYTIDTNRVYIAGHSLGGSGTYHIGLRNADLFAAVSPNAGGCHGVKTQGEEVVVPGGYVANLFGTGIFISHFDQDPRVSCGDSRAVAKELGELRAEHPDGYDHVYVEGKGVSHAFPPGADPSTIIDWMTRHRRQPYPKKVVWEPGNPEKRTFAFLRMAAPFPSRSRNTRVVAKIDGNAVEVTGTMTRGLSIRLADEMFDAARPVTVTLNGKQVFSGPVSRDPATLLESILTDIDPARVFAYRIDL